MPKEITLIQAKDSQKEVIKNLMQLYIYDFSEFVEYDMDSNGLFKPYPALDDYWSMPDNRFPYLIVAKGIYVGFALIKKNEDVRPCYSIAEFFVMKKYRRLGIGRSVAFQLFGLHKGAWEVHQRENNTPAIKFWKQVIAEYSSGKFAERFEDGRFFQTFET